MTGGRQGSAVRTDGNGNVYVAWEDGGNQVYAVSTNGGVSYSRPRVIGPVTDLIDPIPGSNFRNDSFLSLASSPAANSTTLYAAWVNRTATDGSAAELVVYRTTGAGWTKVATPFAGSVTGTGVPFFQGLDVAANGRVDLGWQAMTAIDPTTFGTGNAASTPTTRPRPRAGPRSAAPTKVSTFRRIRRPRPRTTCSASSGATTTRWSPRAAPPGSSTPTAATALAVRRSTRTRGSSSTLAQ